MSLDDLRAEPAARLWGARVMVLGGGSTGGIRGGDPIIGVSGQDNETKGANDLRDVLTEGLTWLGVKNAASSCNSIAPGWRMTIL